jgi:hypothetical protein
MLVLKMFLFATLISFITAKLEINVEGKHPWASDLPTWRRKDRITSIYLGDQPLTGYHIWLVLLILTFIHSPYIFNLGWTPSRELQTLAAFCFGVLVEDFFWFLLNPFFGLKKLNRVDAPWHNSWLGLIPGMYWKLSIVIVSFLIISFMLPQL